jgi:hypothetical protein
MPPKITVRSGTGHPSNHDRPVSHGFKTEVIVNLLVLSDLFSRASNMKYPRELYSSVVTFLSSPVYRKPVTAMFSHLSVDQNTLL